MSFIKVYIKMTSSLRFIFIMWT